ncbi:MAG: hypothetical protein AAF811_08345 [Pseudomonadota bacterium]
MGDRKMRYYDPFDASVEPVKQKPAAGTILDAARGVTSPRTARLKAKGERIEIARDAETWDFGSDPMIWARSHYGQRDLSREIRFDRKPAIDVAMPDQPKRLISVLALVGALTAIGQLGATGVI